jgi:hypothetical protein
MNHKNSRKQSAFIVLSTVGITSLFSSFAGNLQPYRIYQQETESLLGKSKEQFIVLANSGIPKQLDTDKAVIIDENLGDYSTQKILLLVAAIASSSLALIFSSIDFESLEVQQELEMTEREAKKQLKSEQIKHRYALMSKAQQEMFKAELEALLEVSGGDDSMYIGEVLESDKFLNCQYMLNEGHSLDSATSATWQVQPGTREHSICKLKFEAWQRGEDPSTAVNLTQYEDERGSGL